MVQIFVDLNLWDKFLLHFDGLKKCIISPPNKRIIEQIDGLLSDGTFFGLKNAFASWHEKMHIHR